MRYRHVIDRIAGMGARATLAPNQSNSAAPGVPNLDADIGACRAAFNVNDGAGEPLYNAEINITIKYGFMNLHKAQLEAPTNTNGQARFTGLPNFSRTPGSKGRTRRNKHNIH